MEPKKGPTLELTPPEPEVKKPEPAPEKPVQDDNQISLIRDLCDRKVNFIVN